MDSRQILTLLESSNPEVKRLAFRKRLERAVREGKILRIARIQRNEHLYCLPYQEKEACMEALKSFRKLRPKLHRLQRTLEKTKFLFSWEAARIMGLPSSSRQLNRALSELEALNIFRRENIISNQNNYEFLVGEGVSISDEKIEEYSRKIKEERIFTNIAGLWLKRNRLVKDFWQSSSRSQAFDAIGRGIGAKYSFVVLTVNLRRPVSRYEMEGFIECVYKFIYSKNRQKKSKLLQERKQLKNPVYAYFFAKEFEDSAWKIGKAKGMKMIRSEHVPFRKAYRTSQGLITFEPQNRNLNPNYFIKNLERFEDLEHLSDMKGLVFELLVDKALKQNGYETYWRDKYYLKDGIITEKQTKREFTDIDVRAVKEGPKQIDVLLCECRNWERNVGRNKTFTSLEKIKKVAEFLEEKYKGLKKKVCITIFLIGSFRKDDIEDAKRECNFDTDFLTKTEFRKRYFGDAPLPRSVSCIFD